MSCSNCFNGCTEITSDKCVKYTGADIPALGIQNGDTLQFVEQTLAQFIITALDGTGIKPIVDLNVICDLVKDYIPVCSNCTGPTLNDLLQALMLTACDLQNQIENVVSDINVLEGAYTTSCLTVVNTTTSVTHNVLQAVITKLCALQLDFDTLVISLPETYVALNGPGGIQDIITNALEDAGLVGPTTKQYTKMVPYTVIPWFAPDSYVTGKFDGFGVGTGEYENIYLCNGLNGTPDMRGRVPAGLTNGGMLGLTMDPEVAPSIANPLIPTYALNTKYGNNFVTLQESEMPLHNHSVTVGVTIAPHKHEIATSGEQTNSGKATVGDTYTEGTLFTKDTELTPVVTVNQDNKGQNQAHKNTQPTIGCYYIMYIPV